MAKFYIQLENQRLPIGEITREEVLAALGIDELFNFTGNFYDLDNNPFSNGANGEFNIVDDKGNIIAIVDKDGIHSIEMTAEDESGTVHKLTDKMDRSDFDEIISMDGNDFVIQDEDGNQGFVLTAEGATAHDFITYKGDSLLDIADRVESVESNVGSIDNMISATGNEFIIQDDKANPNVGLKLNSEGLFVKDVTLNNGEHVLSQKADKTYVDDVKSDMTTELNTKINSLDATVSASGRTYGVKVSVAQTNGKLSSVTVDDSAINFSNLVDNPIKTESSDFIIQDDKANPNVGLKLNSEGLFVKDVTLNNGEHVLSQKADKTYVDDVKSDMTTELNTKINSLDATVTTSGSKHGVKVSVTQTNGKLSSVSVDDSKIDFTKLTSNPIDVNEESQSFVIKDGRGNKGFVLNSEGAKAKDFTTSTGVSLNGLNTTVVSIRTEVDNINNMISAEEEGSLIIRDNSGNVGLKLNDKGLYVQDVTAGIHTLSSKANKEYVDEVDRRLADIEGLLEEDNDGIIDNLKDVINFFASVRESDKGAALLSTVATHTAQISDNASDISTNASNITTLTSTVASHKKELEGSISNLVASHTSDIATINASIASHTKTITSLSGRVSSNEGAITKLNSTVGTHTTTITTLNSTVASHKKELEGSISDLTSTVASNKDELNGKITALSKTVASNKVALEGSISNLSNTVASHTSDIATINASIASHTKTITSLSGRVSSNEGAITKLNSTVGTHTTTITTLNSTVASHALRISANENSILANTTAISNINNITSASATINSNVGTPTVTVSYTGETSNKKLNFEFKNLKGDPGATGVGISSVKQTTTSTVDEGENKITVTLTNNTSSTFTVKNGSKGPTGVGISKITKVSGNSKPGTADVYNINYTDNTTTSFSVVHGNNGNSVSSVVCVSGNDSNTTTSIVHGSEKINYYRIKDDSANNNFLGGTIAVRDGKDGSSVSSVVCVSGNDSDTTTSIVHGNEKINYYRIKDNNNNFLGGTIAVRDGAKGEKGDDGTSVNIKGSYDTYDKLIANVSNPVAGDGYIVNDTGHLWVYGADKEWIDAGEIKGPQGDPGVGVSSVKQTTTATADEGNNIITVTLTNGSSSTFTVKNGSQGSPGTSVTIKSLVSSSAPGEASTITFSDNKTLKVYNGADGRGITSVTHTSTSDDGLTKTYTIAYTTGSSDNFKVKDGAPGAPGTPGADGRGITSVTHTSTSSDNLTKTYTIAYTSGSPDTFKVKDGAPGAPGEQGYSVSSVVCVDGVDSEVEKNISDTPDDINYYRIKDTNNEFLSGTIGIKNGKNGNDGNDGEDGVNITSVVQTQTSDDDGGENKITVYLSDETEHTFIIKNGSRGPQGETGPKGADGTSVKIKDTLDSTEDLKGKQSDAVNGDGYIIGENLYVYTGGSGEDIYYGFKNVGKIKGPKGDSITITPEEVDGGFKFIINNVSEGTGDGSGGGVFTGDIFYEDILDAPITMDDSGVLDIADDAGYIIAKIDSDGITTTKVKAKNGFYQTSDETLKVFHDSIEVDFNALKSIPKAYYTWKDEDVMQIGTSAQKVQELYPEIVSLDEKTGKMTLDYAKLSVIALKAIDLLHEENENLKLELKSLHNEMDKIKSHLGL